MPSKSIQHVTTAPRTTRIWLGQALAPRAESEGHQVLGKVLSRTESEGHQAHGKVFARTEPEGHQVHGKVPSRLTLHRLRNLRTRTPRTWAITLTWMPICIQVADLTPRGFLKQSNRLRPSSPPPRNLGGSCQMPPTDLWSCHQVDCACCPDGY